MHVCVLSYMAGRVGLVGLGSFAVIEAHTIEAYSGRFLSKSVWRSDLLDEKGQNKLEE